MKQFFFSEKKAEGDDTFENSSFGSKNTTNVASFGLAPTASPEIDEDGYCIKPEDVKWQQNNDEASKSTFEIIKYFF